MKPEQVPEAVDNAGSKWARNVLIGVVIVAAAYLVWSIWDYQAVMRWMETARPTPFFIAMALLPMIGLPMTAFALLAGATFGISTALIGTALALAVNLSLSYWIGRAGLREHLASLLARFGYKLPDFDVGGEKSLRRTAKTTMLIKMAPAVPGFLKNYGLGAARVPFWLFFAMSMVISGVYVAALVVLGESLFQHELGTASIAILVLVLVGLGVWWWYRRERRNAPTLETATPVG